MSIKKEIVSYPFYIERLEKLIQHATRKLNLNFRQAVYYAEEHFEIPYDPFGVYVIRSIAFAKVAYSHSVEMSRAFEDGEWFLDELGRKYNDCKSDLTLAIEELGDDSEPFKSDLEFILGKYAPLFE